MKNLKTVILLALAAGCVLGLALTTGCTDKPAEPVETADPGKVAEPTEEPTPTVDPKLFTDTLPKVEPNENLHITMKVELDENGKEKGYDIFAPLKGSWGYRYGPSILYYPDGSMDAWFATPGTSGEWDWFTYKHSDDGGKTWSKEKVVLTPTPDSMDHYSVCDPGVIYFNGYYYIGYTSCIVSTNGGINNNCYVARSKNPDGPFEKWNGNGWGGDPQPFIYFDEEDSAWGAGEVSFVVVDETLYIYYTWTCPHGNFTKVGTSDLSENWPGKMQYRGFAYTKDGAQDSCDVVYVEDYGKFLAFSTYNRFTANSCIAIFESDDGIKFKKVDLIHTGTYQYLHNMGISKRPDGHVQMKDLLTVGYAYSDGSSDNWGKWATHFQPVSLIAYEGEIAQTDKKGKGTLVKDYFWTKPDELWPVGVEVVPQVVEIHLSDAGYQIPVYWYDTTIGKHRIVDAELVSFDNYDTSVIEINGLTLNPKAVGKTLVTVHYEDCQATFKVYIRDDSFKINNKDKQITSFRAVNDNMTVYLKDGGKKHLFQIRGLVEFDDGTWGEAYNDKTSEHPDYPAMVDASKYSMTFEVEDENILKVNKSGVISPKAVGTTNVKVTITGGLSFTVKVTVEESRE